MASIRELPLHERPTRRLVTYGPGALSDAELLAIVLRVGVNGTDVIELAQQLLIAHRGWTGLLRAGHHELCQQRGMGEAKASTLKATLEIGRRLLIAGVDERPQIKSPADVASLLMLEMGHLEQEHLRAVLLDTKNRVQEIVTIYVGSVNSAQVRVGEVFRDAVRRNSAALIVAHNHPSGDPTPSPEDVLVTRQIVEAGKLLDIDVLDHLILSSRRYVSLRERGLGFSGT
jgi:DNA repair protein RadC